VFIVPEWLGGRLYRSAGPKKRIFISFDYDNDRNYRYLLSALNENTGSEIEFEDLTPEEIQSYDVGRIKAALTRRIKASTHTLTIVGSHANGYHDDWAKIGTRNWQWWEIEKSKDEGLGLIAVKIGNSNVTPDPLLNASATWARAFKVDSIVNAINSA
jgi:hypothetical protein